MQNKPANPTIIDLYVLQGCCKLVLQNYWFTQVSRGVACPQQVSTVSPKGTLVHPTGPWYDVGLEISLVIPSFLPVNVWFGDCCRRSGSLLRFDFFFASGHLWVRHRLFCSDLNLLENICTFSSVLREQVEKYGLVTALGDVLGF